MTLTQVQSTKLVSLIVTLVISRTIRLQYNGNLSFDGFNRDWALTAGGLVLGQLINQFGTSKLMKKLREFKLSKPSKTDGADETDVYDETEEDLLEDMTELMVMLVTQQIFVDVMNGRSVQLSASTLRTIFLAVCGLLIFNIALSPVIDAYTFSETKETDNTIRSVVSNVIKKILSLATADYMSDLDFDNFQNEAAINAIGVGVGEYTDSHLINMSGLYDNIVPPVVNADDQSDSGDTAANAL